MTPDPAIPTCWNCGYELRGLRVDDLCPECGKPIWSRPALDVSQLARDAGRALTWGVAALVLFFLCIGPLAGLVAIPAITGANRIKRVCDNTWPQDLGSAKTAWWLGWITVGLSVLTAAGYAVLVALSLI